MDEVGVRRSGARGPGPGRSPVTRWWPVTLAGAAAFWLANLAISLTPMAAAYRAASSIAYLPMLAQAAVGGLVVATLVTLPLARFPERVPGGGPVGRAVLLAVAVLVLATLLVEVPAKVGAGIPDAGHWLLVATGTNATRILALGVTIGLLTRDGTVRHDRHRAVARRETRS